MKMYINRKIYIFMNSLILILVNVKVAYNYKQYINFIDNYNNTINHIIDTNNHNDHLKITKNHRIDELHIIYKYYNKLSNHKKSLLKSFK